jgi:site-specific recombinase XerD
MHLLEDGENIRVIQELLGHRYLKITEIYLHVSAAEIKRVKSPFNNLEIM